MTASVHQDAEREHLPADPHLVEVRRNAVLLGSVAGLAAVVSAAWFVRAVATGELLDWAFAVGTALIALLHLAGLLDARSPLLVADGQGVRLRRGRSWRGLPWSSLEAVEVEPGRHLVRDGHLTVVPEHPERALAEMGRQESRVLGWLTGDPLSVPLGLATRVVGAPDGLPDALAELAGPATEVVQVVADAEPGADAPLSDEDGDWGDARIDGAAAVAAEELPETTLTGRRRLGALRDPRPALATGIGALAGRWPRRGAAAAHPSSVATGPEPTTTGTVAPVLASAQPLPAREMRQAVRADLELSTAGATALAPDHDAADLTAELPEARELRRPGGVSLVEDTQLWGDRLSEVAPIARPGDAVAPLVMEDHEPEPAPDPVLGPELAAARTRLALSVDQLAERTRIRPHVIESIEVDDFAPCGGDFYARGHLRTLCRVLGIDVAPLLATYDERYAHAPVSPRRVFEAELASGGSIRATRGGLNWSLLIAVVMGLVLTWSVARLVMDSPVGLQQVPGLHTGSGGLHAGTTAGGEQVPVLLHAAAGGARVVVRNGDGDVVYTGDLEYGATRSLKAAPPVHIESSDGGVEVVVDGVEKGRLGEPGQPASGTFIAR